MTSDTRYAVTFIILMFVYFQFLNIAFSALQGDSKALIAVLAAAFTAKKLEKFTGKLGF